MPCALGEAALAKTASGESARPAGREGMMGPMTRGARALGAAWCALAICALGCSASRDQPLASNAQGVTQTPVTITLSAPTSLSPIGPVLEAENSLIVDVAADVVAGTVVVMGTGGLQVQNNAVLNNDAWSVGVALLQNQVDIKGTLHATQVIKGLFDVVGATDNTPAFDPPATLSWTVTPPSPGSNVTVNIGQSQSLMPGSYGTVTVNSLGSLTLSTGTYYLANLNLLPQTTVYLNQANGPVIIYVTGAVVLQGTFNSLTSNPPDLLIAYLGNLPVNLGQAIAIDGGLILSPFVGAVIAPSAQLVINPVNGVHTGFFAAQNIILGVNAEVQYGLPMAVVAAASPPGPQCAALLGTVPPAGLTAYCSTCALNLDSDLDGVQDCIDGCPNDPHKTSPGVCGCGVSDEDTDGDGFPDCIDGCPLDPNNTSLGQCGCVGQPGGVQPAGTPCTDSACSESGSTCNGSGVCGNRSSCSPAAGARLFTSGGTSFWLVGPGFENSALASDGGATDAGVPGATESSAQAACTAKGLTLTRINSLTENRLITKLLTAPIWLGANDISASGTWWWSAPGTNNGTEFWSGGATGAPVNSLFSDWGPSAPGSQTCASMRPVDGFWFDTPCTESLGYVCEYMTPLGAGTAHQVTGEQAQPPAALTACVPQDAAAVGPLYQESLQQLENDIDAARNKVFVGSASNPPDGASTCPSDNDLDAAAIGLNPDAGGGCLVVATGLPCPDGGGCTNGFVCRQVQDTPNCSPPDAGPGDASPTDADTCKGTAMCVELKCPPDPNPVCSQIEICNPGTTFDASPDPGSHLDAAPYNPALLFDAAIPEASTAYSDPPEGTGPAHTWCHMGPQDPGAVLPANQGSNNNTGSSSTPKISFDFQPNLIFNVNPNPLALGETNLALQAQASLDANVSLNNFLGQNYTASIVHAEAALHASRCSVDDNGTALTLFGLDLIPLSELGIPQFNTAKDFPAFTTQCNNTINTFQVAASRAKKAFRDAQQLLHQYHNLKADGGTFGTNLCQQLGVATSYVPGFPGGNNCFENEPPEWTINRFVDFYEGDGSGALALLAQASQTLQNASSSLEGIFTAPLSNLANMAGMGTSSAGNPLSQDYNMNFLNIDNNESITIINAPFVIGPIPMVFQVDVFTDYGIQGNFTIDLNFSKFGLMTAPASQPSSQSLAQLTAQALPYASAGLSAYVGAGIDLGPIGASVGIEGAVTLAQVQAPIHAGAGVDVTIVEDSRPGPPDIVPPVSVSDVTNAVGALLPFGKPKSFSLSVWYNYGMAVDLQNILSGEVDAELRINFFFFSRTWRERVVKFNGWSYHFDLVGGGSSPGTSATPASVPANNPTTANTTPVAEGLALMGLSQAQLPLTILARLAAPTPNVLVGDGGAEEDAGEGAGEDAGTGAGATVDKSQVQTFLYENLCCTTSDGCQITGQPPTAPPCCAGYVCQPGVAPLVGLTSCVPECRTSLQPCGTNTPCCGGGNPPLVCGSLGVCVACAESGQSCATPADCCKGAQCVNGLCGCAANGASCTSGGQCCSGDCGVGGLCVSVPLP
jgi:hypothetical protein